MRETVYLVVDLRDDYAHPVMKVLGDYDRAQDWGDEEFGSDPRWDIESWPVD